MMADVTAVLVGALVATVLQWLVKPVPQFIVQDHMILLACSLPLFLWGALVFRLYQARANERPAEEWGNIVKAVGVTVGGLVLLALRRPVQRVVAVLGRSPSPSPPRSR